MDENFHILNQRKIAENFGLYNNYLDNPIESLKDNFVIIKDEKIEFKYITLVPKISILIPKDFFIMERKIKRVKFLGNLKNNVYTSEDYNINIHIFDTPFNQNDMDIESFIEKFKKEFRKIKTESVLWDTHFLIKDSFKIYYFEQLISAGISNAYSIIFFIETSDGYYSGFITFSEKEVFTWRYIGLAILEHIKINEEV